MKRCVDKHRVNPAEREGGGGSGGTSGRECERESEGERGRESERGRDGGRVREREGLRGGRDSGGESERERGGRVRKRE